MTESVLLEWWSAYLHKCFYRKGTLKTYKCCFANSSLCCTMRMKRKRLGFPVSGTALYGDTSFEGASAAEGAAATPSQNCHCASSSIPKEEMNPGGENEYEAVVRKSSALIQQVQQRCAKFSHSSSLPVVVYAEPSTLPCFIDLEDKTESSRHIPQVSSPLLREGRGRWVQHPRCTASTQTGHAEDSAKDSLSMELCEFFTLLHICFF